LFLMPWGARSRKGDKALMCTTDKKNKDSF